MRTFEIIFAKKDGSIERAEWIHKKWRTSMFDLIERVNKRADEIDMVVKTIRRIN